MLSPNEASKHFSASKTTILRDIKEGRLSASRNERGHYKIDPSELARVYGGGASGAHRGSNHGAAQFEPNGAGGATETVPKLALVEQERDAAQNLASEREKVIADLRHRLDKSEQERSEAQTKLTALLTDQRPQEVREKLSGFRWWLVAGVGLLVGGAIAVALTQLSVTL